ncbi:MAG: polyphosphate kinase 1 [Deltaproteobacteria bacterium]|nr:polyphosphate kinase 1 [Deltaproteobacteria bacterium]
MLEARACTPPDRRPAPPTEGGVDLNHPDLYLNRELTWLNFNFRVLNEARDPRNPLLERVRFAAIVASNLDEFFMKRIGGLKQQVAAGLTDRTSDGRSPAEQIQDANDLVQELERQQCQVIDDLLDLLLHHGIDITTWGALSESERASARAHYTENIFPLVTPQATDPAHPFPFISNLSLNLLVTLRYPEDERPALARVKVPVGQGIPRFVRVGPGDRFVLLEEVMAGNLDLLFPGMEVLGAELFRVTRNANTEQNEEDADDLLAMIESELRDRRFAPIVRLQIQQGMVPLHRGRLAAELGLDEETDVFEIRGMLGRRDLVELTQLARAELLFPPHHPVDHPRLSGERNVFHVIRDAEQLLVHHPYENFHTSVERFLAQAASDPKVLAIKMTLYRTSKESRAVSILESAALAGKQVAVVVELKARFDEAANILWASRLEEAGAHVTYGVVGLKTHCKAILVVRRDYDGLRRYAHIGTGNYHAGTARLYSDFGVFTADPAVGKDLTELFNYLTTGYSPKRDYLRLLPAPKILKKALLAKIDREIALTTPEARGRIVFKMNALEDREILSALYRASMAGVKVDLLVRDTCRLRPGLPGVSDNIRVISIVGRFLEHARVYVFHNGGEPEIYLGSADAMTRNLSSRVEVVVPLTAPGPRHDVLWMLELQLNDQRSGWEMRADGSYYQRVPRARQEEKSSQQRLTERYTKRRKEADKLKKQTIRGRVR